MDKPLLEVEHLTIVFEHAIEKVTAVNNVSFSIPQGKTLGLVGESGSGKSMTAFGILRLLPSGGRITAGTVRFNGYDLMTLAESKMQELRGAKISLIFQEPIIALNPTMQVGKQIAEALTVHHKTSGTETQARVVELLEAVRIPNAIDRVKDYPHQLSGGMRQRIMIAIALACRPLLLIADEPTTALDMTIQAEVLDLLRELRATYNLSLLLITHDFGVIAEMADYVAVMHQGKIVEQGPVRQILRQPLHAYTRSLLEAVPGHSWT